MKLATQTLTILALSLLTTGAQLPESGIVTGDLSLTGGSKPHAVALAIDKREKVAEVDSITSDSNTVPVEDSTVSIGSSKGAKNIDTPSFGKLGSADLNSDDNTPPESYVKSHKSASTSELSATSTTSSNSLIKAISSSQDVSDDKKSKSTGNDDSSDPFLMAISMIVVSEIGDKTFLISALMAMRNNRYVVFAASFAAMIVMTVISGIVGHALPTLLSPRVTQFLAAILFVVFGIKLTKEGLEMSKDLGVEEELAEVEEEISLEFDNDLESGRPAHQPQHSNSFFGKILSNPAVSETLQSIQNIAAMILSPLFIQVFIMNFLGEWGDRSQIATIAMAAGSNYWAVICGAIIGHGLCTATAVIGGKMLASKISMRTVTLGGAFAFFVFAILYFVDAVRGGDASE